MLALVAAHDVTHVADGGLETPLGAFAAVSIPLWAFLGAAMAVVVGGDAARSRLAALLMGASVAAGFVVVHLIPVAPTALWQLDPSIVSWVLVWAATGAGIVLVALAWLVSDRRRVAPPRAG